MSTKGKVSSLIDEDETLEDVIESILAVEEENGVVEWGDVREDATSGQWGRLIEKGILVDAESGDGFVVKDADEIRELLGIEKGDATTGGILDSAEIPEVEDLDTSWSIYDKAVGLVGVAIILFGYRDESFRELIAGTINGGVMPLVEGADLQFYLIILIFAVLTGMYSSYLQLYLMDWDWIKAQQKKLKAIQSEIKEAQMEDDDSREDELREEQMEAMSEQLKMFKMQFRPSVWIMSITIPIFLWLLWGFSSRFGGEANMPDMVGVDDALIMPFIGEVGLSGHVAGPAFFEGWLVWYIICSFGFGQIMRKALGVNPTT